MAPRLDVSKIRRDQILTAARALFVARGVANVRLDEIAVQLDVSKAALYLYYPGKDAIVAAVLDQQTERMSSALRVALHPSATPFARLLSAVYAMQSDEFPIRLRYEIFGLSCVALCRALLGADAPRALTPFGLYRRLQNRPEIFLGKMS